MSSGKCCKFNSLRPSDVYMWDSKLTTIDSDSGLEPGWPKAIISSSAGTMLNRSLATSFSEILNHTFSFKKMHLKLSPAKWRPFCLGLNVLRLPVIEKKCTAGSVIRILYGDLCVCVCVLGYIATRRFSRSSLIWYEMWFEIVDNETNFAQQIWSILRCATCTMATHFGYRTTGLTHIYLSKIFPYISKWKRSIMLRACWKLHKRLHEWSSKDSPAALIFNWTSHRKMGYRYKSSSMLSQWYVAISVSLDIVIDW